MQDFLDEAEKITQSQIGFFHFVEADQINLSLQAWSTNTRNEICQILPEISHYSVDKAGVWVDCIYERQPVIHNDYASLHHRKGLPKGHAPVIRELVVPIIKADTIVAIFGIGNKPTDYTQQDVEIVQTFGEMAWDIISRKQADESPLSD